ncbi:TPA: metallophosphoesterase [Streptococcus pneumoniae]|mgnify:FL=1|uniref:Ser/Thr protein phosphatase family protein n=10 Tax=Streptococcus pneumoniae TaxID=1313 RepID=A0ABC9K441_STREE|nr:metallophosphoesterase [Streptococcus pneumoniae]EGE89054.1 calcineurin-like phosphoesterase family protein [Streptococcus pneumoniae GA04375]EHD48055.1 calcineurin-like phosphoesterase family protein [Streptococcus pneumoniae GA49138]EHD73478.1 calcineurin-like phosphoesterase family protein [Streptococcus pneumoniae GA18523]EHD87689.1 calcineurin-like phosphoesterase family protein [Streptococcus pneumoniae GA13455]EHD98235.1 calcineurin-like phosphoesterase family protein [Streptococcus 
MAKLFAISDIHGHLDEFLSALSKVDLSDKNNRLILIGDYIDNGHQSFQVISKIIELEELHPNQIITLLGNHEEWFYDWLILENPTSSSFSETIKSFFSPEELTYILKSNVNNFEAGVRNEIKNNIKFNPFINWFKKRYRDKRYYETDTQIFVHAGIDEEAGKLWKDLTSSEMFTNKFPITTGGFFKDIVSGHIASWEVAKDKTYQGKIYFDGKNHYFIDGDVYHSKTIPVICYDTVTKSYQY